MHFHLRKCMENVLWKMAAIFSRPKRVKFRRSRFTRCTDLYSLESLLLYSRTYLCFITYDLVRSERMHKHVTNEPLIIKNQPIKQDHQVKFLPVIIDERMACCEYV